MWRKVFDILFWLGASTYFGGLIIIGAIVAPAVFAVSHDSQLSMPGIVPPLPMDRQVGGEIFGTILNRFAYAEAAALTLILIAIAGWFLTRRTGPRTWIILILWIVIGAIVTYDSASLRPKMFQLQQTIRSEAPARAADPTAAWPNRELFDALHKSSESLAQARVYALLAMIIVAAWSAGRASAFETRRESSTLLPPTGTRAA